MQLCCGLALAELNSSWKRDFAALLLLLLLQ